MGVRGWEGLCQQPWWVPQNFSGCQEVVLGAGGLCWVQGLWAVPGALLGAMPGTAWP